LHLAPHRDSRVFYSSKAVIQISPYLHEYVSEELNEFARWLFFANGGKIPANLKHEQSKIVKYNHLLANFAILYNVNAMTEVFNQLKSEGHNITRDHMAAFSPYHTEHLGRLGSFELDLTKQVRPMTFELLVD